MTWGAVRRAWFQVHKWIGIALAIVLAPLALSGSVLLLHDWIEEAEGPAAVRTVPLPPSRYVAAARAALPNGARIASLVLPTDEEPAVVVRALAPRAPDARPSARPPVRTVRLDPAGARVLPGDGGPGFFEGTFHRFHGSLLIPVWGRSIVGWLGLAMLLSSLTGLWLWWPRIGTLRRALRWRRGQDWDFNLHHQIGFWIALPLAVLSLTGAWIAFPNAFGALVGEGGGAALRGGPPRPLAQTVQPVDAVAARAAGPVTRIDWPTERGGRWTVRTATGRPLTLDDASGARVPPEPPRQGPVMRAMRALHEGTPDTGPVWRAIVVLGGIAPPALAVTGILMWLRSRRWRARVAARRAR